MRRSHGIIVLAALVLPALRLAACAAPMGASASSAKQPAPGSSAVQAAPSGGAPAAASQPQIGQQPQIRVEVVVSGLEVPWALAFAPDGRLFFTERPGRIRVMVDGQLLQKPVAEIPVVSSPGQESGLMGLALDPDFANNGYIYVDYSYSGQGGARTNRLSRFTVQDNTAADEMVLLDNMPAGPIHNGGRVKFGPDGKLYFTDGDSGDTSRSQNPESLGGKVFRINSDGTIPEDNPFPGSPVFTMGHRNPEGLAFQPGTDRLFSTEHGPVGHDEVNVLRAGGNYGWPDVAGAGGAPRFLDPIAEYNPSIAPTGATFYDGDLFPAWKGSLFFTTLRGEQLHRIWLGGPDSTQVAGEERLFEGTYGRLRDVIQGPDGFLYFTTSNRDGRGSPAPDDDRILRIVPE